MELEGGRVAKLAMAAVTELLASRSISLFSLIEIGVSVSWRFPFHL